MIYITNGEGLWILTHKRVRPALPLCDWDQSILQSRTADRNWRRRFRAGGLKTTAPAEEIMKKSLILFVLDLGMLSMHLQAATKRAYQPATVVG